MFQMNTIPFLGNLSTASVSAYHVIQIKTWHHWRPNHLGILKIN